MLAKIVILIWTVIFFILLKSVIGFLGEVPAEMDIVIGVVMGGLSGFSLSYLALNHLPSKERARSIIFFGICFSSIIWLLVYGQAPFKGSLDKINGLLITSCLLGWGLALTQNRFGDEEW